MYCVLSFRVTCLFVFHYSGIDAMGRGLKGINHDKRKDDRSLNSCKAHPIGGGMEARCNEQCGK